MGTNEINFNFTYYFGNHISTAALCPQVTKESMKLIWSLCKDNSLLIINGQFLLECTINLKLACLENQQLSIFGFKIHLDIIHSFIQKCREIFR